MRAIGVCLEVTSVQEWLFADRSWSREEKPVIRDRKSTQALPSRRSRESPPTRKTYFLSRSVYWRGHDILFNLKSPTGHSRSDQCCLCWCSLICWSQGCDKGEITCWYVCGRKRTLSTSYNSPSRVFVPRQRTTHASLGGPVSSGSRRSERSQHHFQAGRNTVVEHAWGRRPPNRREHLHKRCQSKWLITAEDVLWKVNSALAPPPIPQPLNPSPQAFVCTSLEYSKCIIIKAQPVVGLHCNF